MILNVCECFFDILFSHGQKLFLRFLFSALYSEIFFVLLFIFLRTIVYVYEPESQQKHATRVIKCSRYDLSMKNLFCISFLHIFSPFSLISIYLRCAGQAALSRWALYFFRFFFGSKGNDVTVHGI